MPNLVVPDISPTLETTSLGGRTRLSGMDGQTTLPGQPRVRLGSDQLLNYLRKSLLTGALDKLAPYMWLITTPRETISPLHHHEAKGRTIVVSESPDLHCIWYSDKIFMKPIPPFMLSAAFWEYIQEAEPDIFRAAAGFIRSYGFLIQHEVDFRRAISPELQLIPKLEGRTNPLKFEEIVHFLAPFERLDNAAVSPRYSFGAIRLSSLNRFAWLIGKLRYFHVHAEWSDFFAGVLGPFISLFVVISVALNAMQVGLTAESLPDSQARVYSTFVGTSYWVSVLCLVLVAATSALLGGLWIFLFIKNRVFALSVMRLKRANSIEVYEKQSSAIM